MTECNTCGDCCVDIPLSKKQMERFEYWAAFDPDVDEKEEDWKQEDIERRIEDGKWYLDLEKTGEDENNNIYKCLHFNEITRLCEHENRPPICRDYPWYGKDPQDSPKQLPLRCSFWNDVDPSSRPDNWVFIDAPTMRKQYDGNE